CLWMPTGSFAGDILRSTTLGDDLSREVDMKRTLARVSGVTALFSLFISPVFGQYGTGTILGSVSDPTGAVIPGVKVIVKNEATNETREFVTDSDGFYRFGALQNGSYSIIATAPSFRTATLGNLTLTVNSELRADIVMQIGNISEKVEV